MGLNAQNLVKRVGETIDVPRHKANTSYTVQVQGISVAQNFRTPLCGSANRNLFPVDGEEYSPGKVLFCNVINSVVF
jgi:hypothetical protein